MTTSQPPPVRFAGCVGEPLPADLGAALTACGIVPGAGAVHYFAEITSTNDVAAGLAEAGAPEGTTVVAEMQTAGRGRLGRAWFSPPGAGLYVSVVLRPQATVTATALSLVTLIAGVAVAEGLRASSGLAVEIRWPNDLVAPEGRVAGGANLRKLAGLLAEGAGRGNRLEHVVLGIGVNLRRAVYPAELGARVTSLEEELGRDVPRGPVFAQVLAALWRRYQELLRGEIEPILARWRSLSPSSVGSRVAWDEAGTMRQGTTAGLEPDGALLVRTDAGVARIVAGGLRWM